MNGELKREREALRLTQADAAARMGVHEATWRRWEQGRRRMPESALRLWARVVVEVAAEFSEAAKHIREGIDG